MAAGDGGIFHGLRFKLFGFDSAKEDEYRAQITERGGSIDKLCIWKDLHLIVSSEKHCSSDKICVEGRSNGAVVVNELWLDDTLEKGSLADTNRVLYRPPVSLSGIKGAQFLHIAHTGFSVQESRYVENLAEMMGAQNAEIENCSYLICNTLKDYEAEKSRNVFSVNKRWLEDSIAEWEILSVDEYTSWPRRSATRNYRTPVKDENVTESEKEGSSTRKKDKSRGSPDQSNPVKRQSLSRRSLDFNWRNLSDYMASEMVMNVRLPKSNIKVETGTAEFKSALLGSYAAVANIQAGGECIRNSFSASTFRVSRKSDQVIMIQEELQLVEYDAKLAVANRNQFTLMVQELFKEKRCTLPDDIAVWLSCISHVDRVPDNVLKRHINMLHPIDIYASFVSMFYIVVKLKQDDFSQYTLLATSKLLKKYMPWVKRFRWKLLNDTLTYINPKLLELTNLRSQGSNSAVFGQTSICKAKERDNGFFGILDAVRDCFIHPAVTYKDMLLQVMLTEKPMLLSDLQRALFELGHLPNLK